MSIFKDKIFYNGQIYEGYSFIKNLFNKANTRIIIIDAYLDYSVLEKSQDIYVIPSDIKWDDIGSWEALERYRESDEKGNILLGDGKMIQAYNNLVVSSNNNILSPIISLLLFLLLKIRFKFDFIGIYFNYFFI